MLKINTLKGYSEKYCLIIYLNHAMLLADSHITMVVGVDVHVTTAPPFNPIHPYIGMVMDPADYIPFLGTN
ncbi:hypothetical protein AAAT70_20040, partial [Phocaeicola vulgatus]|uniref:hypothetical protein n=1 Tax=Phocaeicola vulgatus TaxID=821 RepID=UPI0032BF8FAA